MFKKLRLNNNSYGVVIVVVARQFKFQMVLLTKQNMSTPAIYSLEAKYPLFVVDFWTLKLKNDNAHLKFI